MTCACAEKRHLVRHNEDRQQVVNGHDGMHVCRAAAFGEPKGTANKTAPAGQHASGHWRWSNLCVPPCCQSLTNISGNKHMNTFTTLLDRKHPLPKACK